MNSRGKSYASSRIACLSVSLALNSENISSVILGLNIDYLMDLNIESFDGERLSITIRSGLDALDSRLIFSNNSGTYFISQSYMPECLLTHLGK